MNKYFLETEHETPAASAGNKRYHICVLIEDRYYWSLSWTEDTDKMLSVIGNLQCGFITDAISNSCATSKEIQPTELRTRFGSFAYYIDRAISGFKSYISWISPDPVANNISWELPQKE